LKIAENFGTTINNIKSDNNLNADIYPGQVLTIKNDDE
jgi:LysM repeat protein